MKKLLLIPTTLAVISGSFAVSCVKNNEDKQSIFDFYNELASGSVITYDKKNFTDLTKWQDTININFRLNFSIMPDDVLEIIKDYDIALGWFVKDFQGLTMVMENMYIDPLLCNISSIEYNGDILNEGAPEDTDNCYYWDATESSVKNIFFVLNDFDKESYLSVEITLSRYLDPRYDIKPGEFFATPTIVFNEKN